MNFRRVEESAVEKEEKIKKIVLLEKKKEIPVGL